LIVIGMGKLGGHELNVSSDIDLIFVYPRRAKRPDLASSRIASTSTSLGGASSPGSTTRRPTATCSAWTCGCALQREPALTTSFAGLEHYLLTQGRAWERYAWLKARPITASGTTS
jgi:glutamate-ammonia-ligase adenylyltransferase